MHITNWKKPIWKATRCMIPTIRHSGKSKTLKAVNRSAAARRGWGRYDSAAHRGHLGQRKLTLWYYSDGCVSLYILPSPQNARHQAGTILWTTDFEWLWRVSPDSSSVKRVPFQWVMWITWEAVRMWEPEAYGNLCTCLSILFET